MSLGGGFSSTLNQAVANAVASGVTFAVAAGNSTANACNSSPSSEPSAITVGATDINDGFAYFSNFGSCVDINAPGVNITSDWYSSNTATSYDWNFSDGATASGVTTSHTFVGRHSYTVTLTTQPGPSTATKTVICNWWKCN